MRIEDAFKLKKFLKERLGSLTDAEPNALADYIIALIKHSKSVNDAANTCSQQLPDFLRESTSEFVADLILFLEGGKEAASSSQPAFSIDRNPVEDLKSDPEASIDGYGRSAYEEGRSARIASDRQYNRRDNSMDRQYNPRDNSMDRNHNRDAFGGGHGSRYSKGEYSQRRPDDRRPYEVVASSADRDYHNRSSNIRGYSNERSREFEDRSMERRSYGRSRQDFQGYAVLIKSVPSEYLNERDIKDHFSQYGPVEHVSIDFRSNSARVYLSDNDSVQRALADTRPIFENRFVQIQQLSEQRELRPSNTLPVKELTPLHVDVQKQQHQLLTSQIEMQKVLLSRLENADAMDEQQRTEIMKMLRQVDSIISSLRQSLTPTSVASDAVAPSVSNDDSLDADKSNAANEAVEANQADQSNETSGIAENHKTVLKGPSQAFFNKHLQANKLDLRSTTLIIEPNLSASNQQSMDTIDSARLALGPSVTNVNVREDSYLEISFAKRSEAQKAMDLLLRVNPDQIVLWKE